MLFRVRITEPESRYFMRQILQALGYLRQRLVMHRDVKPGNILLNYETGTGKNDCGKLVAKLCDFGLAAQLSSAGEKRYSANGSPNFVSPECLAADTVEGEGQSFPVDIWASGCILYAMLIGRPPFETDDASKTYTRIRNGLFHFPQSRPISAEAAGLIKSMLRRDPECRPTPFQCLDHSFFASFTPESLNVSCLTSPPDFSDTDAFICDVAERRDKATESLPKKRVL